MSPTDEDRHAPSPSPFTRIATRDHNPPPMENPHARVARPRWVLHMQAVFWRFLMSLGMFFHRLARPRPPKPNFSRVIPSTVSPKPGSVTLNFYVPRDYETQRRLWVGRPEEEVEETVGLGSGGNGKARRFSAAFSEVSQVVRRRSLSARRWGGYPVVINFHGGGFTLGSSGDDARWCGTVVDECNAVVISVDYRLAPECPFPTAVEDGVDAVLYVHNHAEELGINPDKIALSGFSSGANMCFTVPIRLYDELQGFPRDDIPSTPPTAKQKFDRTMHGHPLTTIPSNDNMPPPSSSSDSTRVGEASSPNTSNVELLDPNDPPPALPTSHPTNKPHATATVREARPTTPIKIACLIPWYPPVDYTRTRAQRRATARRADQELPAIFTDLFDDSYLHPPHSIALDSPYLSPGVAPAALLRAALPDEIIMHTCEWDMLLEEGEAFRDRLQAGVEAGGLGKKVWYRMVENVPHGWDKAPNPWKPTPGVREHYLRACKEMRRVLWPSLNAEGRLKTEEEREGLCDGGRVSAVGPRPGVERATTKGYPTAAPRGSVQLVS